jgi:hypothetical protein
VNVTDPTSPKLNLDHLLHMGVAAARAGNRAAARSLFLALAREYPNDVRVWLGAANVAASPEEQREALERVVAISPQHPQALRALASLPPRLAPARLADALPEAVAVADVPPATADVRAFTPSSAARPDDDPPAVRGRFPLLNVIALVVMGLLVIAVAFVGMQALSGNATPTGSVIPSPVLQTSEAAPISADAGAAPTSATAVVAPSVSSASAASPMAAVTATALTGTGAAATVGPAPAAAMPAPAGLPLGTLVEVDGWSATLLRPDYALILDGSIGDLRPTGRFVLALMAVSNNSASPRRIPTDLFTIIDSRGRRYSPAPNASTAYLALYGRGQHGDLALEDDLAASSGMRSVPILFDVPLSAAGLVLTVRDNGSIGWPIEGSAAPSPNVGP